MTPLEHVLIALIPVTGVVLAIDRRLPSRALVTVVVVGAQFPDLVDKPLAHSLHVIPSGRVFMHSLPIAVPVVALAVAYAVRTDRLGLGLGYGFGHLSHLIADNYHRSTLVPPSLPPDLLWPFVEPTPRPMIPHWAGPNGIGVRVWSAYSGVVLVVLLAVLIRDLRRTPWRTGDEGSG